eukprot:3522683-Amphidinium_carterae.2
MTQELCSDDKTCLALMARVTSKPEVGRCASVVDSMPFDLRRAHVKARDLLVRCKQSDGITQTVKAGNVVLPWQVGS